MAAGKILIRLTRFSGKVSENVLDVTAKFNAHNAYYQDMSGWDLAIVQFEAPGGQIDFFTSNDDGQTIPSRLLPSPEVPTNWLALKGVDLTSKTDVTSTSTASIVRFDNPGKYLKLSYNGVAETHYSYAYVLAKYSNSVSATNACHELNTGNRVVYAATATPGSVASFYEDSQLTMPIFGDGGYYAFALINSVVAHSATISSTGALSGHAICVNTTTSTTTTTTTAP